MTGRSDKDQTRTVPTWPGGKGGWSVRSPIRHAVVDAIRESTSVMHGPSRLAQTASIPLISQRASTCGRVHSRGWNTTTEVSGE